MVLILEVVGAKARQMGAAARKEFRSAGTIGRLRDNDWVFPDDYISGHHACISLVGGTFMIEDTSTNGVFLGSPQNRLPRGRPHPLQNGDTVFIDDYEVHVSMQPEYSAASPSNGLPLADDPFFADDNAAGMQEETDPLELIGVQRPRIAPDGPRAANLANNSPLQEYFRPPLAHTPSATPAPDAGLIPDDYDPLGAEEPPPTPSRASPRLAPPPVRRVPTESMEPSATPAPVVARPSPGSRLGGARTSGANRAGSVPPVRSPGVIAGPGGAADKLASPPLNATPASPGPPAHSLRSLARTPGGAASGPDPLSGATGRQEAPVGHAEDLDFAALLAAAGLESVRVSPELAQQFGQILRVVVTGLMDVLRARERIKDEFRMRMTTFKTTNNNPLKFSANVEDALHNLLVKRNAAYLGPVQAFEDAFQDVRNHQMAMLAGVRVAYEAMLNEFEPGRLQEEFDAHVKAGSFLGGPGKSKYWELYRNKFHDMVKDADTSFRKLFGDEFAKAYEEQLERLKTLNRSDRR